MNKHKWCKSGDAFFLELGDSYDEVGLSYHPKGYSRKRWQTRYEVACLNCGSTKNIVSAGGWHEGFDLCLPCLISILKELEKPEELV